MPWKVFAAQVHDMPSTPFNTMYSTSKSLAGFYSSGHEQAENLLLPDNKI
jgi:hypothetical protein